MMAPDRLARLREVYSTAGVVLLNTVVLLLILNAALYVAFRVRDRTQQPDRPVVAAAAGRLFNQDGSPADNGRRNAYQFTWFDYGGYDGIPQAYASDVLDDFHDLALLGFSYQPWVQFSEPAFAGKRVNVEFDRIGFPIRRTVNPANDDRHPVAHVFTLGGSTTFGYHVSDEHTWPSYLSRILNEMTDGLHIDVTNYGRGYFNPSQEAVLLADLLKTGHRPSLVIFLDGVNLSGERDVPAFTGRVEQAFHRAQFPAPISEHYASLPIFRLVNALIRRWSDEATPVEPYDRERHIRTAVNSFRQSREMTRAIAGLYGVDVLFVLQPNALYNYDLSLFRLNPLPESFLATRRTTAGVYDQLRTDREYLDLSALFGEWGARKAVIDAVHYSPAFNEFLARRIAGQIDVAMLRPRAPDEAAATGAARR